MPEKQKSLSVSFRVGDGVVSHNNRELVASNVDPERIKDNIIFKQEDVRKKYHELFDAALEEYNARQTRRDRKIRDYYDKLVHSEKERAYYEIVVQFGDAETCGLGSENWELCEKMLGDYVADFEKRNPNLKIFNAVLHADEMTPHLHIDFIPVAHKNKNGLSIKNSMKGALTEMGFTSSNRMVNEMDALCASRKTLCGKSRSKRLWKKSCTDTE